MSALLILIALTVNFGFIHTRTRSLPDFIGFSLGYIGGIAAICYVIAKITTRKKAAKFQLHFGSLFLLLSLMLMSGNLYLKFHAIQKPTDVADPFKAQKNPLDDIFPTPTSKPESQAPERDNLTAIAAPNFSLQDIHGRNVMLSDYIGKVVILNFWATWAPPCRDAIPGIEKLHNTYKDRGLVVLAISLDQGGWDGVKSFMSEYGITYIVLKGTDAVSELYQVRNVPMILVIDKTGKIMKRYIGLGYTDEIEADIKMAL